MRNTYIGTPLVTMMQKTKNYIRIREFTFNWAKILSVTVRKSYFYIWNPYILEIVYDKITPSWTPVVCGHNIIHMPVEIHPSEYKFKFKDLPSINNIIKILQQVNVRVINTIAQPKIVK